MNPNVAEVRANDAVGELVVTVALPFARFTVTGPAASVGLGPASPVRRSVLRLFAHEFWSRSVPSPTHTVQL